MATDPNRTGTVTIIFTERYTKTATHMGTHVHADNKLHPDVQNYKLNKHLHLPIQAL